MWNKAKPRFIIYVDVLRFLLIFFVAVDICVYQTRRRNHVTNCTRLIQTNKFMRGGKGNRKLKISNYYLYFTTTTKTYIKTSDICHEKLDYTRLENKKKKETTQKTILWYECYQITPWFVRLLAFSKRSKAKHFKLMVPYFNGQTPVLFSWKICKRVSVPTILFVCTE